MISLLPAELRRQLGRRGSIFGSIGFNALFGLGILVYVIIESSDNGNDVLTAGTGILTLTGLLSAIVIGATAGSYDVDQGTMRYLVLTGRPRWQLALVRVPALLVTVIAVTLPAILLVLLASLLARSPAGSSGHYFDLFYSVWMGAFLYGVLSLAIGTFLKSAGVAIAISVVANFAAALISGAISAYVSENLGHAMFGDVASVVIAHDSTRNSLSLAVSSVVLVVWLVALLGAATLRVQRAEY
jgi:ABC-type transport system involved in multi-copper enzyme maturation permease subunit